MLEQSKQDVVDASPSEKRVAEILARRYLAAEFEENLIPEDDAKRIVAARVEANDETWSRAVYAILMGLRAAEQEGFTIADRSRAAQQSPTAAR